MCLVVIAEVELRKEVEAPASANLLLEPFSIWVLKKFQAIVGGGPVMMAICPRI